MAADRTASKVDHTALRVNQASIITLLIVAYLLNWPWLAAFVMAVMLMGTIWPAAGLFKLLYARVLRPVGLLKPDVKPDEPQPHLFAQGMGALVLLVSVLALYLGAPILGWILAGIVVFLAAVNLFLGFCAGCFIFYQLARRGIRIELAAWRSQ